MMSRRGRSTRGAGTPGEPGIPGDAHPPWWLRVNTYAATDLI